MNTDTDTSCNCPRVAVNVISILASLLIVVFLVAILRHYTAKPSLFEERSAERMKILADFHAANDSLLEKYDWQDQEKGVVHIPISRAKELMLEEWKNPDAARSNLIERAAKAFAVPPKAPPKKNEYE